MSALPFDICVLTAANEQQARGYKIQLEWRRKNPAFARTDFRIIADPGGARIGSGGSTFLVLHELFAEFGEALFSRRILILHSGGDSRRLPAYSAVGKIFMPLPTENFPTLFDVMLENYAHLPNPAGGQVVVASGDVLLNFDPAFVQFSPSGITGVAYPENPSEGRFFGVYVVREPAAGFVPADDVLQKPALAELQARDAIDSSNRIWLDTGILNLAPDAVKAFLACDDLIAATQKGAVNYNLYHEILYAVSGKLKIENADRLAGLPLFVNCLPYCGFYHVGKSRELLTSFYTLTHASAQYHFRNGVRSNAATIPALKSAWAYNSVVKAAQIEVQRPGLIEGSFIQQNLRLDGHNLLTNIPQDAPAIHLQEGICLNVLPLVNARWVAVLYGIDDQFKGPDETFLNQPLNKVLAAKKISPGEIWSEGRAHELWQARLFPSSDSAKTAIELVLKLQEENNLTGWLAAPRLSMLEILQQVDQQRLLEMREQTERRSQLLTLSDQLPRQDFTYADLAALAQDDFGRHTAQQLEAFLEKPSQDLITTARAQFWLGQLLKNQPDDSKAEKLFEASFASIRRAVAAGLRADFGVTLPPAFGIRSDEVVWTLLPARLDFAGGWTDTPPICLERGGCVLNASVTLNGQYPIQVVGKIKPDNFCIGINSIDLGQRATISTFAELADFANPADWLSLPKAAFYAAGIFPPNENRSLPDVLRAMGGGFDLTLFSALPAGSGLGTSSILGAGLIATLTRLMGVDIPRAELYARTSNLEQLMTTGGGWQDQIGGVAGGVKLITTSAGYDQTPQLAWTHIDQPGLDINDHFLLYYTGIRRMAKNLLRQVVGRYLKREAEALVALDELAYLARAMKEDLDQRRLEAFGKKIRRAWALNKTLDAGQTTAEIEAVLARIDDFMFGAKLLGAGGGGFLFIVAKDKEAAVRIRRELSENPPNERARFFLFNVDAGGMRTSVL